jgi:hypothetical protein
LNNFGGSFKEGGGVNFISSKLGGTSMHAISPSMKCFSQSH